MYDTHHSPFGRKNMIAAMLGENANLFEALIMNGKCVPKSNF